MNEKLENIVKFFKTRAISANISPKIEVNYRCRYWDFNADIITEKLKEEWEKLREELNANISCIKKQEWEDYGKEKHEKLCVNIDGVIINLIGADYPNTDYVPLITKYVPTSDTERANRDIDDLIARNNILWCITHCSKDKYSALMEFIAATRRNASPNY